MTSLPIGWKPIKRKEKGLLINTVLEDIRKTRQEIYDNAKYYSPVWKKEQLQAFKVEAVNSIKEALEEVKKVDKEYEDKIDEIENTPYNHTVNKDFLDSVNYTKSRLLAELKTNPVNKKNILDMAVASKSGAQAVLELIDSKQLDNSYWTEELYTKAFVNSKSQAELEFELKKDNQIKAIQSEWSNAYNRGHYFAAEKILKGDVSLKVPMPSLEWGIDREIEEVDKQINGGR